MMLQIEFDSSGSRTRNLQLARVKGLRPLTRRLVHYPIVLWSHGNIFPSNINAFYSSET